MLKRIQGERNSYSLLMGKQTGTLIIEISFLQKDEFGSTTGPNFTSLGHTPKALPILLERYLLIHFHFGSIHKNWKL